MKKKNRLLTAILTTLLLTLPFAYAQAGDGQDEPVVTPGSGFVVAPEGLVATNRHVVEGARIIRVMFPILDMSYGGEIVFEDAENDLAILKLSGYTPQETGCVSLPYQLDHAAVATPGQKVESIGFPLQFTGRNRPASTAAAISGNDSRFLQIDAETPRGWSGSPLFDADRNVLGVVTSTDDSTHLLSSDQAAPTDRSLVVRSEHLTALLPPPSEDETSDYRPSLLLCLVSIRATK